MTPTLGVQSEPCRCSENIRKSGGIPAEARGKVYKGRGQRATVQVWREMVGGEEAGWLHVGPPWGERDRAACAQACDGVPKILDLLVPGGGGVSLPRGL